MNRKSLPPLAVFVLAASLAVGVWTASAADQEPAESGDAATIVFARDVQPIFEATCKPCHFPGGKMHARAPFDKAETIERLGKILLGRVKNEEQKTVLKAFLDQQTAAKASAEEEEIF